MDLLLIVFCWAIGTRQSGKEHGVRSSSIGSNGRHRHCKQRQRVTTIINDNSIKNNWYAVYHTTATKSPLFFCHVCLRTIGFEDETNEISILSRQKEKKRSDCDHEEKIILYGRYYDNDRDNPYNSEEVNSCILWSLWLFVGFCTWISTPVIDNKQLFVFSNAAQTRKQLTTFYTLYVVQRCKCRLTVAQFATGSLTYRKMFAPFAAKINQAI